MLQFSEPPRVEINPNECVPLVAMVYFKANEPATAEIEIDDGRKKRVVNYGPDKNPKNGLPIIGMRADTEHKISVTARDESGESSDTVELSYRTPRLPDDATIIPRFSLKTSNAGDMEPGFTLLSIRRRPVMRAIWMTQKQAVFQNRWSLLVAIDEEAEVVWYYIADSRIAGVHQLQNGNLFFHHVNFRSIEMDMCGNIINQFHATNRPWGPVENSIGIEAESLHHQPHEMPNGNFLALTANAKEIKNYYTSEEDPDAPRATQKVVGDTIVEFTPEGDIVWNWNTFDYLDPMRIGYQLLDTYWHTRGFPNHLDWTHGNGVTYDHHDDSIIVSLRHQDAIIKIDRKTKEIIWILGDPAGWEGELKDKLLKPTHDLRWHYHGHNPRVTGENQFVMYDNGICRALPFHGPSAAPHECFSRAIEYQIDPDKMEVSEVWVSSSDESEDRVISWAMGDAHRLPQTDNMLVIDSFCTPEGPALNRLESVTISDLTWNSWNRSEWHPNDLATWARIREMKRDGDREIVFQVRVDNEHDIVGWEVFGGARVKSLCQAT